MLPKLLLRDIADALLRPSTGLAICTAWRRAARNASDFLNEGGSLRSFRDATELSRNREAAIGARLASGSGGKQR